MKDRIYFDNASTSWPKPEGVAKAMCQYIEEIGVNTGRGVYASAIEVSRMVFDTREKLRQLFNGSSSQNVIFTANVTQALNMVLKGFLKSGDHVLTSGMEHNGVIRPLYHLKKQGVQYDIIPAKTNTADLFAAGVINDYEMDLDALEKMIRPATRAIVMIHGSNVSGCMLPVDQVGKICQRHGLKLIVDSAQTAGCHQIDIKKDHIDALCFTGHKGLRGPQGIGGFLIDPEMAVDLETIIDGGTGSISDLLDMPDFLPDRFEAGTLNLPGIYGLNAALDYLQRTDVTAVAEIEGKLVSTFLQGLEEIADLQVIKGDYNKERCALVSVYHTARDLSEIAYELDRDYGILTRVGLHCAPLAHQTLGTYPKGTLRFSFSDQNTMEEIQYSIEALKTICERKR
ncbi:MAG: aminotransferase class V-fold PLP-dependent enzyme [Firmicutes bacterium]|nr:aminotransferase class V-fold PLP-dependent enzyme [Bacillota bacterium]